MKKTIFYLISYYYLIKAYIFLRKNKEKNIPAILQEKVKINERKTDFSGVKYIFDRACSLHFLNIECYERSLATFYLLNLLGKSCTLCVGLHHSEILGHAWIETQSIPEFDESYYRDNFSMLSIVGDNQ
ncbi:lasso peptide biosynthesis B2 protein [Alkalibacterium sp. f15]|uniref:lasso peptide biosynthesis B2 protein n=1 Tax=Alkalibacterium sp. f15 TaxID=3414029 RepID=UPI003BF90315